MARLPRLTVPGYPHHVIQRGNNRQPTFHDDADYELMLDLLTEHSRDTQVAIHSYALMGNHLHLLVTPETQTALPRMMQAVGRRYVQAFNQRHRRTGTLWEGRYRSALVQTDRYLLACMAYIDLNPVRAGIVARASAYRWSSHAHYIGQQQDRLISPHPLYWQLGNTPFEREARYLDLVNQGLSAAQQTELTSATLKGWALGDAAFTQALQKQTDRRLRPERPGRPPTRSAEKR